PPGTERQRRPPVGQPFKTPVFHPATPAETGATVAGLKNSPNHGDLAGNNLLSPPSAFSRRLNFHPQNRALLPILYDVPMWLGRFRPIFPCNRVGCTRNTVPRISALGLGPKKSFSLRYSGAVL